MPKSGSGAFPVTWSCRHVHTVPNLRYDIDEGMGDFLSPKALRLLAVEYQGGLLSRLNDQVKDTQYENLSVFTTIVRTAQDPNQPLAFNMASQAMNNSFFLDHLRPPSKYSPSQNHERIMSGRLHLGVDRSFGSLSLLKSTLSAAAMGMISSGWIWLVTDLQKNLAIIPTYGAGTIIVRARAQRTPRSGPVIGESTRLSSLAYSPSFGTPNTLTPTPPASPLSSPSHSSKSSNHANPNQTRSVNTSASGFTGNLTQVGSVLNPLFCISLHEHAWMTDYGLWGKEEYLKRFWNVLDWEKVSQTFDHWNPRIDDE
ncbi:Manganese/iron superoxide dismutase [Cantharellus anzutake]|uniref:Manganese/iron superoxide dismutase n=1 Tax=Cantharellus anzutake TaxID=1750568 RepID=UPI001907B9CA|nr:Manganese/iron superoxide dismutase [Cantharellus anzutake]KAF8342337.1 Manganese/iron superoxide dismutase [Cantharellus anzutake]